MRDIFLVLIVLLGIFVCTQSRTEWAGGANGSGSGTSSGGFGSSGVSASGIGHIGGSGSDWVHRYSSALSGQYKENNPNLARRVAGVFMYKSPSDWPFKVSPGTSMAVTGRGPNGIPHV